MGSFFAELKRRHIYRVAAAYAVVAWVLLQLFNNLTPMMKLPEWAGTLVLVLLAGGFPLALIFAWVFDLKTPGQAPVDAKPSAGDRALIGVLLIVLGLVSYQQFAPTRATVAAQSSGVEEARVAAGSPKTAISIAVLPFANMSGDAAQEFFSDGMTEEITAALAKVPDLSVVGRTSAFQFKGQNQDLRAIGQSLNATHLIEGSVRKAGDRVRITVQLIKAEDGTHIWAENYDRQLTDIFATQEDIARAITTSLRMPLGLKPGENLVNNRDIDPESYQQFLRARALDQAGGIERRTDATALLEQIVARHPNYAPAWALLVRLYDGLPGFTPQSNGSAEEFRRLVDEYLSKADAAGQRAIQLDPNMPELYDSLASRYRVVGKLLEAEAYASRAIALDPGKDSRARILDVVGRVKETLVVWQKFQTIEPLVLGRKYSLMGALWVNGQNEEAIALEKTLPPADSATNAGQRAVIYASMGRYGEAIDRLGALPFDPQTDAAIRLLRTAPAKTDMPQNLPALGVEYAWVYLYVGAESRVLDNYESRLDAGRLQGGIPWLWHPSYAPVRKTERFKAFARKAGMVEYWRAKGWPEFCHPTTADDFACN